MTLQISTFPDFDYLLILKNEDFQELKFPSPMQITVTERKVLSHWLLLLEQLLL